MARSKIVCGVGVNDADYTVVPTVDGRTVCCPYYRTWVNMLRRCYSPAFQADQPSYIGCSVAPEWHSFMAFRKWMLTQGWQGKQLDKDLLIPGNKVYGPDACVFLEPRVNSMLLDGSAIRGDLPLGVDLHHGAFRMRCRDGVRRTERRAFKTAMDAHRAWQALKVGIFIDTALAESDPRISAALVERAHRIEQDVAAGRETLGHK